MKRYERWMLGMIVATFVAFTAVTYGCKPQVETFLERQWYDPAFAYTVSAPLVGRDPTPYIPPPHMRVPAGVSIYDACMHPSRPSTPAGTP